MNDMRSQAVTGVVPPQIGEAVIREARPSVTQFPFVASIGRRCIQSFFLAPLGWFLMLPFYFFKILPFVAQRFTLTNRRLMIQRGLKPCPVQEIKLEDIEDVKLLDLDDDCKFFRSGHLQIWSQGKPIFTMYGVPQPESFRLAIIHAIHAWAGHKAGDKIKKQFAFVSASAK